MVNQGGLPVEISSSDGTTFDVPSFYATALTNNTQVVTVTVYKRGKLYASVTFTLEPGAPPLHIVLPPQFYGIDAIVFRAYNPANPNAPPSKNSTLFALDDLVLSTHSAAQPPPAQPQTLMPPPAHAPTSLPSQAPTPRGEQSVEHVPFADGLPQLGGRLSTVRCCCEFMAAGTHAFFVLVCSRCSRAVPAWAGAHSCRRLRCLQARHRIRRWQGLRALQRCDFCVEFWSQIMHQLRHSWSSGRWRWRQRPGMPPACCECRPHQLW